MVVKGAVLRKPLRFISREELDNFKRENRDVRWALKDMAPYMRARDQRAFRHWVFVMGWLCCLQYYEGQLQDMAKAIAESAEKTSEHLLGQWETRTHVGLMDGGGYE